MMIEDHPHYLFVFGAVGSGNTFMYSCLTASPNTYGVNEDALGSTLERIIQNDSETGRCPHGLESFKQFLSSLRRDRNTLVLKTPSNLRRLSMLRQHLGAARFVYMIREPHGAIVSGLKRHAMDIAGVASHWENDARAYLDGKGIDMVAVTYEDLVRSPTEVFAKLNHSTMPIHEDVLTYAARMNRPERAGADRWRERVTSEQADQIEAEVQSRNLSGLYEDVGGVSLVDTKALVTTDNMVTRCKKELFRLYYRLAR